MKPIHKKRLRKLARYLLTQVPQEKFDMLIYRIGDHDTGHICGTAGCALGWSPAIMGREEFLGFTDRDGDIDYLRIAESYFGIKYDSRVWNYIFSGNWAYVDNTPQGAAARILYLLDRGVWGGYDPSDSVRSVRSWNKSHYQGHLELARQKYLTTGA